MYSASKIDEHYFDNFAAIKTIVFISQNLVKIDTNLPSPN